LIVISQIEQCEERLKQAMLQSDVAILDELLATDMIFTNHLGQLMTKQDDLEAHRSGAIKIDEITLSNRKINIRENIAIVSVHAYISGSFAGSASETNFRFTRVWHRTSSDDWQVIVGHSSIVKSMENQEKSRGQKSRGQTR